MNTTQLNPVARIDAPRMPSFASSSWSPVNDSSAISSATVNPMPATVAAPTSGDQVTVNGNRPSQRRLPSQVAVVIPTSFPTTSPTMIPIVICDDEARSSTSASSAIDEERNDVVDDHEGQQEDPDARRAAAADEGEDSECECRVRPHDDAPPASATRTRGEREVDQRGRDHPADGCHDGRGKPPAFSQLTHVELAPDLESDHEEEERHEPVVDPVEQIERELFVAERDRQLRVPELFVGRAPR